MNLNELRDQAYENSLIYKEKAKKIHDSKIKNRVFNVGDRVFLFNSRLNIFSGKLKTRWTRPFTVAQVFPYGTVELSQTDGPNFKTLVPRQSLTLFLVVVDDMVYESKGSDWGGSRKEEERKRKRKREVGKKGKRESRRESSEGEREDEGERRRGKEEKGIEKRDKKRERKGRRGRDNGTGFVNQTLREYYEKVGISHETFVARFP
ncbi:hypothetical protein Tco_0472571 [Tanacetum coccineum]